MVILGGMGNIPGTIIAGNLPVLLPEFLRGFLEYRMLDLWDHICRCSNIPGEEENIVSKIKEERSNIRFKHDFNKYI